MRAFALILPLALAACDRENYDASRNSPSSSRRVTQTAARDSTNDPAIRRREQLAAANKDPEFRRLREQYEAALLEEEARHQAGDLFWNARGAQDALAEYYALHYPDLGIEVMGGSSAFVAALYQADAEKAFLFLQTLPFSAMRDAYASEFCRLARGEDIERAWPLVENLTGHYQNPRGLKSLLVGALARSNPEAAWETWQSSADPQRFLAIIPPMDAEAVFPARLIERIPEGEERVRTIMRAMEVCRTPENAAPVIAWLATQPVAPAYDNIYSEIAAWQAVYGEPAESERWIEKIGDPDARESNRKHVAEIDDAFRAEQRKDEQERLRKSKK